MAELKRVFSKAIMNKDMDERLVPNGQYRDASNIQISTSDDSDVGSVQTLLGNTKHNTMADASGYYGVADDSAVVASIAAADRDKIYYCVAAGSAASTGVYNSIKKDYILEYNALTKKHKYVFVDIYEVSSVISADNGSSSFIKIAAPDTVNKTGVRIGMTVAGTIGATTYTHADNLKVSDIKYNSSHWEIYLKKDGVAFNDLSAINQVIEFKAPRVLNFSKHAMITGINVLDNAIYWTDDSTEPKKVNIDRSIAGTGGVEYLVGGGTDGFASATTSTTGGTFKGDTDYFHTRLVKDKAYYSDEIDQYNVVTTSDQKRAVYVEESHITVIKKSPTQPLEVEAYRTSMKRVNSSGTENAPYTSMSFAFTDENEHDVSFSSQVDYRVNDIIIIANSDETSQPTTFTEYNIRAKVIESNVVNPNSLALSGFKIEILSRKVGTTTALENYYVRLEDTEPLFEFKFPRFSYRYKYQDGEYSTFAPWSQIAFLPSVYEYLPKKGYNFGMVNQIRSLKLKRYHANENSMPEDVVEIDLLYKETNNPTVYTVKTIKRSDGDPLWPNLSNGMGDKRGEYVLTTDMVHAVVASNQLLRPWDNVPRKALAQEISANRLIYGNYVQNYTILKDPIINVSLRSEDIQDVSDDPALPSVKSLRTYQVGVVFSDKYGRETPVLTHEKSSIKTPKDICGSRNRLSCSISNNSVVPDWADYYSYYIKETSVEYHTLAMDRWYDAWDGNIWLSFPSSDRNKVNEETFLELKSEHGSSSAVLNKARYKVLAIENEAPDYVKTTSESLGTLTNINNSVGSPGGGYPTLDGTFITIQQGAFEAIFGSDLNVLTPDNLGLRFYGGGSISKEYDVRRLTLDGTLYKISITDKFGDDIAFASTGNSFDTGITDLVVELFDRKIENKPEFDGRFFVKIFKDENLNNYVLNYLGDPEMIVSDSFKLGYINNNGYDATNANGVVSLISDYLPDNGNSAYGGNAMDKHPTEYSHHTPAYLWGNDGEAWQVEATDIASNPILAINDETTSTGSAAEEFWQGIAGEKIFFIDASTAFSWNGKSGNRPGRRAADYNGDHIWFDGFATNGDAADDPNNGNSTGNMKSNDAQPSRGIWGNYGDTKSYMDISWCGMGVGWDGGGIPNDFTTPMQLRDVGGEEYQKAWLFIKKLVKEGTVFRFQKDPDLTQYTVISDPHPVAGTGLSSDLNFDDGYSGTGVYESGTTNETGAWGIRNFGASNQNKQWAGENLRQRWTIGVTPAIGATSDNGYNPIHGTKSPDIGGPASGHADERRALKHDALDNDIIEILEPFYGSSNKDNFTDNPAVWETEPKESVDLDIYYQASGLIPLDLVDGKNEELIPIGSTFTLPAQAAEQGVEAIAEQTYTVTSWNGDGVSFTPYIPSGYEVTTNSAITFKKRNYYELKLLVKDESFSSSGATQKLTVHGADRSDSHKAIHLQSHYLDWNNCWAFGNGVESDRIRDDFNAPQLDNGVKASTVLAEQAREERRKHGLIWSGIYNSTSGVNNTNQFIMAEAITKDLNPIYGSIQALLNKDTRLVMLCEDKILRADTNKDLLFNADGSSNLVASNKVVGSASPYQGDYGISTNPESMVTTPYQTYFTDATRGHVIALSNQEGLRSVSSLGMKDYFSKLFEKNVWRVLGTYDSRKNEYNLTVSKKYTNSDEHPFEQTTLSYNELSKGWVSFKSFNPQDGLSLNNDYFTFDKGHIYIHHDNAVRNSFYGVQFSSDITVLFNDNPGAVKSFTTINYEGTQAKVSEFDSQDIEYYNNNYAAKGTGESDGLTTISNENDGEYFNLSNKSGWYVDNVTTDMETCKEIEFKEKEGKWFGVLAGESMGSGSSSLIIDNKGEATVQGIGLASIAHSAPDSVSNITITVANNTTANTWDTTSVVATEASRWTCSSETLSVIPGSAITGGDKVDLTISNVIDGVNSGFPLSAADFEVPGATLTSSGSGNSTQYIYTVDDDTHVTDNDSTGVNWEDIDTITFKNNGNGGDLDNTVNVRVQFKSSGQTWPSATSTYFIDIDTKAGVSIETTRKACLFATYNYYLGQSVATTNYSDITQSVYVVSGTTDAEDGPTNKHTGTVPDGSTTEIASYKFTASSDKYYGPVDIKWHNLGEYSDYYSHAITDEVYNASDLRTSWTARLYYTPPQNGSLVSDPEDMCNLGHLATAVYSLFTPERPPGEGFDGVDNGYIHKVNPVNSSITANGLSSSIEVVGDTGSAYNITVRRYADDNTTVNGYYNFTSKVFQTNETSLDSQIPNQGVYVGLAYMYNDVEFPSNSSSKDITYDVIIDGLGADGLESTLSELVPVSAHDLDIIQYGINDMSITAEDSHGHPNNSYVADSIIRAKNFSGSRYKSSQVNIVSGALSVNAAAGKTKLVLDKRLESVSAGDWVINPFGQTTGVTNAIEHLTQVVSVDGYNIEISKALQAPGLNTRDSISFVSNVSSIKPFEVKVTKAGGEANITAINTSVKWKDMVGGLAGRSVFTDGVTTNSKTITVSGTTRGILPGQQVDGIGVVGVDGATHTHVATVVDADNITVVTNQTLPDDTTLSFSIGQGSTTATQGGVESGVKLLHLQAHVSDPNNEAKIQGYLKIDEIKHSTSLRVYSDLILTQA